MQISNEIEVASIARADIAQVSFDAQSVASASDGDGQGLLGYYFANTNVLGPVQVRIDPVIDFNWGVAEPLTGLGKDYFAIIWMGHLEAPSSGEFTFTLNADDNARLQIGSDLVIEAARREQREQATGKITLEKGERYPITLLYRDLIGAAKVRVLWSGPDVPESPIPGDRLHPASFVAEHSAEIAARRGVLTTTYTNPDFSGKTSSQVESIVDSDRTNATRWTGTLRAGFSEPYTFYVATEGPVRLRVNGERILDKWRHSGIAELKAHLHLAADKEYDLEVESLAPTRLLWSSPSQEKSVIPETHLRPTRKHTDVPSPTGPNELLPAGVLLRNGSFVACRVEGVKEDAIECSRLLEGKPIPLHEVARIVCQPLPRSLASRVTSSRPGVLLPNGDFVEGTFMGMEGTRVTISSVLLGLRTYDSGRQVLAVIIRPAEQPSPPCEIQLRDQSVLFTDSVLFEPGAIVLSDKLLADIRVEESQIQRLRLR